MGPRTAMYGQKRINFLPILGVIHQYLGLCHPGNSQDTSQWTTPGPHICLGVGRGKEWERENSYLPPAQDELLGVMRMFRGIVTPITIPQLQNCKKLIVSPHQELNYTSEVLPSLTVVFLSPSGSGTALQVSGSFLLHRWQREKSKDVYPQKRQTASFPGINFGSCQQKHNKI